MNIKFAVSKNHLLHNRYRRAGKPDVRTGESGKAQSLLQPYFLPSGNRGDLFVFSWTSLERENSFPVAAKNTMIHSHEHK